MVADISGAWAAARACWWCASQLVGCAVLLGLAAWLVKVLADLCHPLRLVDRLHQRVVLVTGCDSGFGHAAARRLDALGVPVAAGCLFPEGPGARRLRQDCSSRLTVLPLDVTSPQQVRDAVAAIRDSLGDRELWAVVNNAGVLEAGEAELAPPEALERALAVNAVGVARVTQACLPLLRAARGRVVIVASPLERMNLYEYGDNFVNPWTLYVSRGLFKLVEARYYSDRSAMPILSPYCMSKSAVISYCDALRIEMKKWGVSVCSVEPSSYMSDMNNPDHFKASVSKNFQACPLSVREAYGLDYDDKCTKRLSLLTVLAKRHSNINEVVDEIVDACVGRYHQVRRIPGQWERIVYVILPKLPYYVKDFIMYMVFQWRLTVSPHVKGAEKQSKTR